VNSSFIEYQSALKVLSGHIRGQELLRELASCSHFFGEIVFDVFEGKRTLHPSLQSLEDLLKSDAVKMVFFLLKREGVEDLIGKNLILLVGRALSIAQNLDSPALSEKLSFFLRIMRIFSSHAEAWHGFFEKSMRPIHDKKSRRERRHEVRKEIDQLSSETIFHLSNEVVQTLMRYFLPKGAASLYLPDGGELFLPRLQEMIEGALPSIVQYVETVLSQRELKINFLYWLYSNLRGWTLKKTKPSDQAKTLLSSPDQLSEFTPSLSLLCKIFLPTLPIGTSIDLQPVASQAIETIASSLQTLSCESLLVEGCLSWSTIMALSYPRHTDQELDHVIETIASDIRLPEAIAKSLIPSPDLPVPTKKESIFAFFGLVMYGLKASAKEVLVQGALSSVDWEEAQGVCLERFKWFILSPYFDQLITTVGLSL
jgi:hypothetical protein